MKIKPIKAITPTLVKQAKELAHQAASLEVNIINRINYIMQSIFTLFNRKNAYWYFYGAGEGEVGDIWSHYNADYINIITDNCSGNDRMIILLKDDSEWGFEDSIPTRWLFEDFEQELIDGKEKFKIKELQQKIVQKEKANQNKKEKEKLIISAKKKLSKKELAALINK